MVHKYRVLGNERVYLPLHKVADRPTPLHIQGDDISLNLCGTGLPIWFGNRGAGTQKCKLLPKEEHSLPSIILQMAIPQAQDVETMLV